MLDEMDLALVEYYFSGMLSVMESGGLVRLHSRTRQTERPLGEELKAKEAKVSIPENLFIMGTINLDETTHEISPKVLHRAYVLRLCCDWELYYQQSNL